MLVAVRRLKRRYVADPQVYQAVLALDRALFISSKRNKFAPQYEVTHDGLVTVSEFAALAGRTARAVQIACQRGRLRAIKVGGVWLIDPGEVARMEGAR